MKSFEIRGYMGNGNTDWRKQVLRHLVRALVVLALPGMILSRIGLAVFDAAWEAG